MNSDALNPRPFGNFPRGERVFRVAFLLWLTLGVSLRAQLPKSPRLNSADQEESTGTPAETAEKRLENLPREVEAAETAANPSTVEQLGLPLSTLQEKPDRLRLLESSLRQQIGLRDRLEELGASKETLKTEIDAWRNGGSVEAGPPTLRLADKLRDEADTAQRMSENLRLSRDIALEEKDQGLERQKEAERARRAAEESVEKATDPALKAQLQWKLGLAQIEERLARAEAENREFRARAAEEELGIAKDRTTFLKVRAKTLGDRIQFAPQELEEHLDEADMKRDAVERSLAQLRDTHRANDARRNEAREGLEKARGEEAIARQTAELAARTAWAETSARALELSEKEVELHRSERVLWQRRYLLAQAAPEEEIETWVNETGRTLEEMQRDRKVQESRMLDLRTNISGLEKQFAEAAGEPQKSTLDARIRALKSREEKINAYLAELIPLERLAERVNEEIERERTQISWREQLGRIRRFGQRIWNFEIFEWGGQSITLRKLSVAMAVLIIGILLASRLSGAVRRQLHARGRINENAAAAIEKTLFYLGIFMVIVFALNAVNIPLTLFAFLGGALAIAIGFGAQHIINNFISGIILMIERPIRIGDLVEVDGHYGHIQEIGARSTRLRTSSNIHLLIPNSKLLENTVINWTLSDDQVRVFVVVGVAYGSPTRDVERLIHQAVEENPRVLKNPEPVVLFKDFGDNALIFEVHYWIQMRRQMDRWLSESQVRFRIDELFREANITIAFPQRDIHLDTLSPLRIQMVKSNLDDEAATEEARTK